MKYFGILVLFLCSSMGFSQAQDTRTFAQVVKVPHKTVVDYFLLCPQIGMDMLGQLQMFPTIASEPVMFELKKNLLRDGYTTGGISR